MGKQFQKMIVMGGLPFLLGACSLTWDEPVYFEGEGPESMSDATVLSDIITEDTKDDLFTPCESDKEDCEVSDGYLTQSFTQTSSEQSDLSFSDDTAISLSRPAGQKAVSVKDKQKQVAPASPVVAVKTTNTTTNTAVNDKKKDIQKKDTEDKVLYTTVAIPEKIGTDKTTETTVTTTKIIKNSPKKEVEDKEAKPVSEMMVPLKKTVTTVTETTTKVKQEKNATKDFKKMTLADKVAYGEGVQEWNAEAGNTLRGLLMDWGAKSGWTVVWKLDRDYHLEAGVVFKGTFVDVSGALIRSFARATPAPIGTFHQGNRVLVISTQEDENER